jgi:hypothetical protein
MNRAKYFFMGICGLIAEAKIIYMGYGNYVVLVQTYFCGLEAFHYPLKTVAGSTFVILRTAATAPISEIISVVSAKEIYITGV